MQSKLKDPENKSFFSGENLEEVSAALDELDSVIEALSVDVIKAKVILTHPVQAGLFIGLQAEDGGQI